MKFKRCDRCNREIEEKRGWAKAVEFLATATTKLTAAMRGEPVDCEYQLYRGEEPADLCPDCQKSMQEWLKAGSKSQHQNEQQEPEADRNKKIVIAAIDDPTQQNPTGPKVVDFGNF